MFTIWIACQDPTGTPPTAELPALDDPASHVPVRETPVRPARERPVMSEVPGRPAMVPQDPATYNFAGNTVSLAGEVNETPDEIQRKVVVAESPIDEADRWLAEAGMQTPGCLLDGSIPDLALPSPAGLEHLLRVQPKAFDGTAREILSCVLELPTVTGAQVYGKTAFMTGVLTGRFALNGGKRKQGVVVTPIVTTSPAGQGTLYLVLDKRDEGWFVRASRYIPWNGDPNTRRLQQLKSQRLTSSSRKVLQVTQGDAMHTTQHFVELTASQRLVEVFRVVVRDSATARTTSVKIRGSGYPKSITTRTKYAGVEGLRARYEISLYKADPSLRYQLVDQVEGPLAREEALRFIPLKEYSDALWILDSLTTAERKSANTAVIRAQIAVQRKRYKTARRLWKRASRARDAPPTVFRDYGRFLVQRKQKRAAKKALQKYLRLAPEAPDAADVAAELSTLSRGR